MNQSVIDRNIQILGRFSCVCSPPPNNPVQFFLRKEGNMKSQVSSKQGSACKEKSSPKEKRSLKIIKKSPISKEEEKAQIIKQTYKLAHIKEDFYSASQQKFFNVKAKNRAFQHSPQSGKGAQQFYQPQPVRKSMSPPILVAQKHNSNLQKAEPQKIIVFQKSVNQPKIQFSSHLAPLKQNPPPTTAKTHLTHHRFQSARNIVPQPNYDYFGANTTKFANKWIQRHEAQQNPLSTNSRDQQHSKGQQNVNQKQKQKTQYPSRGVSHQPQSDKLSVKLLKNIGQKSLVVSQKDNSSDAESESIILGHHWDAVKEGNPEQQSTQIVSPNSVKTPNSKLFTGQTEASTVTKSCINHEDLSEEKRRLKFSALARRFLD